MFKIDKNSIDNTGIKQLSKTYWPDLCLLNLSKDIVRKVIIRLEIRVVNG